MAPRPLRPKNEQCRLEADDKAPVSQGSKRRAVSSACIPCRKRKSKCDGALPACSTCTAVYRTECNYDLDSDHRRKGALKRDIQCLQQRNDALDVIVSSLRNLPESESLSLLHSLRSDVSLDVLADSLRTTVDVPPNIDEQVSQIGYALQLSPARTSSIGDTAISLSQEDSGDSSQQYSGAATPLEASERWFKIPFGAEYVVLRTPLYQQQPPSILFFSDPALQSNPGQSQSPPWVPFHSSTLPVSSQGMTPSMVVDSMQHTSLEAHGGHWSLVDRSSRDQTAQSPSSQQHSTFWPTYTG